MSDIIPTEEVEDTPLGHDQLGDIKSYLNTLGRTNITELGQVLGLRYATLRDLPHGGFLNEVMTLWLGEADDVLKKGKPSWRSLVQGLRNDLVRQNGIANKIAKEHPTQGQLTPKYRGPPSSQGSGGPAPSSTSLQEKLMTVLTNDDLATLQTKLDEVAYQWYTIGIQLGFAPGVLKGIQSAVRGDVKSGLEELLTRWLQRKQPPSTLQSLIDVVGGPVIAHQVLAERLIMECGDFPSIRNKTTCDTTIIQKPVKPTAPQPPVPRGSRVKPDSDEKEDTVAEAVAKVENPRGLAVIVTNEYNNYPNDQLPGMETDGQAMEDAFESLGFATLWKRNISSEDMKVLVKSVVKYFQDNPPTEHYVVAFVFSGHGNEGDLLYGEDGRNVHLNSEIVEPLAAEHAIGNIPKLFFIDACRGESELKPVVRLRRKSARELITAKGNYYVAYSTIPKHVAYASDDPNSGSPWMKILAKNLKESEESISNIMETTSKELWGMYENDPSINIAQQTETVSRLHCGPVYLRQKADSLGADPAPQSRMETDPESDPKPGVSNGQHEIGQSKGKRTATGIEMANEDEGVPVTKKTKLEEEEKPLYDDEYKKVIFKKCKPLLCKKRDEQEAVNQFAQEVVIIIQSCNENEYYASLELMEAPEIPKPDGQSQLFERAVRFPKDDDMIIALGMFAGRKAALAWTKPGASCGRDIRKVLRWFPSTKAILGVGMAFGMKRDAVKFCDVLVAKQIADFGDRPRAEKGGIDARGSVVETDGMFCKNPIGWEFLCTNTNRLSKVVPGLLVSSPLLLDDATIKQKMLEQFKDAKGGEMEGWVLYTHIMKDEEIVKNHPNLKVFIIKGVADYADGEKDKQWQLTAAMAAASYTKFKLEDSTAFHGAAPVPPGNVVIDSDEPSEKPEDAKQKTKHQGDAKQENKTGKSKSCWWICGGVLVSAVLVTVVAVGLGLLTNYAQRPLEPSQSEPNSSPKHHPPPSPTVSPSPDKNCHQIARKQDLYTELAEIGNWEALCTHLEVPEATLDGLVHAHLDNTAKKQRCLAAYFDQGNACWEKVVEVVASYPFYKKKLAKQIAEKYGVTWQE